MLDSISVKYLIELANQYGDKIDQKLTHPNTQRKGLFNFPKDGPLMLESSQIIQSISNYGE